MDRQEAQKFVNEFCSNPNAGVALLFLMEKGSETVKNTTEETFQKMIQERYNNDKAAGRHTPSTVAQQMEVIRYAKKLAAMDPIEMIALLGNEVFDDTYQALIDED